MKKLPQLTKILYLLYSIALIGAGCSAAYFSDNQSSADNSITAGAWVVTPPVVINELMWMGSVGHTADEWVELKNMTAAPIDLSGWKLSKNTGTEISMLTLPTGASIEADGYYLISNYAATNTSSALSVIPNYVTTSVDLSNTDLQIKLYAGAIDPLKLIDTAGNGGLPLAGANGTKKQSMSRNLAPGDGILSSNWFTDTVSNSVLFWDTVDGNYGTPGKSNIY